MKCISIFFVFLALFTQVMAGELFSPSILSGPIGHVNLSKDPNFVNYEYDLMYLVAYSEKNNQANNFCLVGYRWEDGKTRAVVHWREENLLFIWPGRDIAPEEYGKYSSSLLTTKSIDLNHNVVEREDQMAMSTYLRRDVEGTLDDCSRHGTQYELKPFTPPPENSDDDW
ncbi:hypothetical protein [Pseudomonas mangiferae]|uniref:DUF3757 domain-containing protein n=1 Tax=Pseudomonas mangiferae TaxID=2593654 RepID=A0A553GVY4_9PSED|nr:hypothetical protein [Pseudomonas mangiferae]TRX73682.1 hypothetical protein FM069_16240 [Pseudomonas mangiferae]